jgi:Ca2+-binding EF-hand superfamily protein
MQIDTDKDGNISLQELQMALSTRIKRTDTKLQELFAKLDLDGNGVIDYNEFVVAATNK